MVISYQQTGHQVAHGLAHPTVKQRRARDCARARPAPQPARPDMKQAPGSSTGPWTCVSTAASHPDLHLLFSVCSPYVHPLAPDLLGVDKR